MCGTAPHNVELPQSQKCCGWETLAWSIGKSCSLVPPLCFSFTFYPTGHIKVSKAYIFWCHPTGDTFQVPSESLILLLRFSKIVLVLVPSPSLHATPSYQTSYTSSSPRPLHWMPLFFSSLPSPLLSKFCPSFQPSRKGHLTLSSLSLFPQMASTLPYSSLWAAISKLCSLRTATAPGSLYSDPHSVEPHLACFRVAT